MVEPPANPPARHVMRPEHRRFLWLILAACWFALAAWALVTFRLPLAPRRSSPPLRAQGEYHLAQGFAAPLGIQLDDGTLARPAGVLLPEDPADAERAAARLRELCPGGAQVFIEREPQSSGENASHGLASIWLPPPGADRPLPFPYNESRLVGAVLVQEGLVRVDPAQPYMYTNEFLMLEDDACRHARGIWAHAGGAAP
jgi:hypothetical protein